VTRVTHQIGPADLEHCARGGTVFLRQLSRYRRWKPASLGLTQRNELTRLALRFKPRPARLGEGETQVKRSPPGTSVAGAA